MIYRRHDIRLDKNGPTAETVGRTRAVRDASGPPPLAAGPSCRHRMRFNHSLANASRGTLLALMLLALPGCVQSAQTSEAAAPPAEQPAYATLAAKYFSSTMADRTSFENFEISGLRWVHALKGWSWLACVHFMDHGRLRTYALFIQNDDVIDGRYAVQSDSCGSQSYTPFDLVTGVLGRPTAPRLPALY